ncbi:hypothetical protein EJB05_23088 [Eragrostis curvula]|uniref:RRM domain-containing protein n=1 Tax=Eragrostis curvula TaxID=38414 RepID=A0A5J9V7A6_9POAL|nr:hypothetical protein EJB05_23088 [Eragrostis curvula]
MAQFVAQFAEPGDPEYAPPVPKGETRAEKKARIRQNKLEQGAAKVAEELQKYDPQSDPNATGDPYKTLFVARLNYETSEHRLKREFETYGPIKRVRIVTDKDKNKPRGYAFIEYTHTRDMKTAYKQADGRKVDNKRVLVDVERGRTVPNWRPRRLGGGLGSSRIGGGDDVSGLSGSNTKVGQLGAPGQRSLGGMIVVLIGTERSLVKGYVKEILVRREPVNAHMTGLVIVMLEKKSITIEIVIGLGIGSEERIGKEITGVTVTVIVVTEIGTGIVVGTTIEKRTVVALMIAIVKGVGTGTEIMSARVMIGTVVHLHERDADYTNGGPKHDKSMSSYGQDYGYSQYEQHKTHEPYGYGQDGRGRETEHSKRHEHEYYRADSYGKMEANYQTQPHNAEPDGPEEGEAFEEGDYQYHQAAERMNEA